MKELFITDLDHTFLHSSQRVTTFSREIWNSSISKSSVLSVATARGFGKTREFLHGMRLEAPLILLDGAMVVTEEKKLIELKTLDKKITSDIITEGWRFGILPFILSLNDKKTLSESFIVPTTLNSFQSSLINKSYSRDPRLRYSSKLEGETNTLKVVYIGEESLLRPLSEHLKKVFNNEVEVKLSPENYMGCYFLTILHPLGDKAHALHKVSEYLDIPLSQITVFGDSINDIEMFKIAGKSVAVSNALDEVKKEASFISSHSNDEDAVAKYLLSLREKN
jgi:Cof subfamily protein (haloacid dehalogenase superfamily)